MGSSGSVSVSPRGEYTSAPNINPTISGISAPTASIVFLDYPVQREDSQSLLTGNTPDSSPMQNEHTTLQITTQESRPPPSKISSKEAVELPPQQRPTKPLLHLQPQTHETENAQKDIFDSFPTPESDEDAVLPLSQQSPSNPSLHRQLRILRRQKVEPPYQEHVFDTFEAPATKRAALEQQIGASPPPPPSPPPPGTAAQPNPNPPRPPKKTRPKIIYVPKKPIQLFGRPHWNGKLKEELMQRDVG
jgi:hypothetical protein